MKNLTRIVSKVVVLALAVTALTAFTASAAETLGFSVSSESSSSTEMSVTVVDEANLQPVEGAKVSVFDSAPTAMDQITDATGVLTFGNLTSGFKSVTVSKDGFSSITVAGLNGANITIYLKALPSQAAQPIVSGNTSGWEPIKNSNLVYAGVAFRNLSVYDLAGFRPEGLISPLKDHIDVMGDREIPSNLALPQQDVNVSIFTIHLDKPQFRLPLPKGKESRLVLLQGNIPARELMNAAQNGQAGYLDVINKLKMSRVGISSAFTPNADMSQNVATSVTVGATHQVTPSAPPFSANVFAAAVTDTAGDRTILVPTDVKISAKAGEGIKAVSLAAPTSAFGKTQNVLTVAQDSNTNRISGIVTASAGKTVQPGAFLDVAQLQALTSVPKNFMVGNSDSKLMGLVFNSPSATDGAPSTPVWYVYSLPGTPPLRVAADPLDGKKLSDYSSVQFEFGSNQIDMMSLKRFTRATAAITVAQEPAFMPMADFGPAGFFKALTGLFAR